MMAILCPPGNVNGGFPLWKRGIKGVSIQSQERRLP